MKEVLISKDTQIGKVILEKGDKIQIMKESYKNIKIDMKGMPNISTFGMMFPRLCYKMLFPGIAIDPMFLSGTSEEKKPIVVSRGEYGLSTFMVEVYNDYTLTSRQGTVLIKGGFNSRLYIDLEPQNTFAGKVYNPITKAMEEFFAEIKY